MMSGSFILQKNYGAAETMIWEREEERTVQRGSNRPENEEEPTSGNPHLVETVHSICVGERGG